MDIYVFVGKTHIQGEHSNPQILLPLTEETFICDDGEELGFELPNGNRRLSIYVYDGWNEDCFSSAIMADSKLFFNICHNSEGEVYLMNGEHLSIITEWFQ